MLPNLPSLACLGRPPLGNEHPRQPVQHKFGGKDTGGRNACSCTLLHVEPTLEVAEGFHRNRAQNPRTPSCCSRLQAARLGRIYTNLAADFPMRWSGRYLAMQSMANRNHDPAFALRAASMLGILQRSSDRSIRFFSYSGCPANQVLLWRRARTPPPLPGTPPPPPCLTTCVFAFTLIAEEENDHEECAPPPSQVGKKGDPDGCHPGLLESVHAITIARPSSEQRLRAPANQIGKKSQ